MEKTDYFSQKNRIQEIMDKSPWDSNAIFMYFSVIFGFPHKTLRPFRNFLSVLPSPTLYSENILDTRVQHCLWGEGRG